MQYIPKFYWWTPQFECQLNLLQPQPLLTTIWWENILFKMPTQFGSFMEFLFTTFGNCQIGERTHSTHTWVYMSTNTCTLTHQHKHVAHLVEASLRYVDITHIEPSLSHGSFSFTQHSFYSNSYLRIYLVQESHFKS